MIEIHTDGACSGNPGRGGWAALIRTPEGIRELSGHVADTTNNRMELQAAIEGLRAVPATTTVTLFSDSEYLVKGMTTWIEGWKRRNWKNAANKPVENRDLWEMLDSLAADRVTWKWVRGHDGNPDNERVNDLAQQETRLADRVSEPGGSPQRTLPTANPNDGSGPAVRWHSSVSQVLCADTANPNDGSGPAVRYPCYLSLVDGVAARHVSWESCRSRAHGRSGAKTRKCHSLTEAQDAMQEWGLPPDLPNESPGAEFPLPAPSTPARLPRSRLFARGVLDRVRSRLEDFGFRLHRNNGPRVEFHLVKGKAQVVAYTTGSLVPQGTWSEPDSDDWAALAVEESNWIRAVVKEASVPLNLSASAWPPEFCQYLFTNLCGGHVKGWSAEPIGRYLLVRQAGSARIVGILSSTGWRQLQPEAADAIAQSVYDRLWHAQTRVCVATHQDQQINLSVVGAGLSRTACTLAGLWDWGAAGDAAVEEQRRIGGQIHGFLECYSKRWREPVWREEAAGVGNQIDVLIEWVRRTLTSLRTATNVSYTGPIEVIGDWGGSEECAARLLGERSEGRLRYRSPILEEEGSAISMAKFLAKLSAEASHVS